jgi:hypothetical protein
LAAEARGAVDLAAGNAEASLVSLRRAAEIWQRISAPYLVASVRLQIGLAHRALGNQEGAQLELEAARGTFAELGARSDLRRVDSLLEPSSLARRHDLSAREIEVLRLIAAGMTTRRSPESCF